ncbi:PilX N-terminal domain-containing pilus assembly protein [Pseudoxanthomonas daejeonensis]|uniref:pilus assembly PilX family protein n=1 Tax=Pseudoxanthomonas daejeonensis TaxID=266062 RepID=UPI001F5424A9|nr:PilX N-terminal domain-containing pilus assembly protein [Pseudoxanthomonas daejeonensis]UNK56710.1 PilX N-terminal domain-containing pilus assembly protein [Pseudoxanthomonas daejeonensis]
MNRNHRRQVLRMRGPAAQRGAALYVALMILILLALLGIAGMQVASLQERMAANYLAVNQAFQTAERDVRLRECYIEGVVNRDGACVDGEATIEQICDDGFDATNWAAEMSTDVPQVNRVSIRAIGPCISGNSSLDMGAGPENEDPNPVYQVTVYATNEAATANAAVDTIFRP